MLRAANENGGAALGAYAYYADGARKSKTAGGATSTFYYTGDQEIAEYAGATLTRRYVRLPGSVDEPFLMIDYSSGAGVESWAHQNRLGSVVAVTDAAGAVIERYTYSAYGESGNEGDAGFPFRFTGQKLDAETGLYYYKARYYDPETGRFLQTDPIGYRDQMNLYAYVGNDPVNATDPSGRCPWCIGAIVGAIAGAVIEKVTNPNATKESIAIAALVGAASGALGPAGGAAARAALVGRAGAKAAAVAVKSGTATRAVKALILTTDVAADAFGQPALGAAIAAASGDDPGHAALVSEGAAAIGAAEQVHSAQSIKPRGKSRASLARAGVSALRQGASNVIKTIAKGQAGEAAAEQLIEEDN